MCLAGRLPWVPEQATLRAGEQPAGALCTALHAALCHRIPQCPLPQLVADQKGKQMGTTLSLTGGRCCFSLTSSLGRVPPSLL